MRQLLEEIDSEELAEWMAFYRLEPWGTHEEDRRMATVAATVANTTPRKQGARAFRPEQFMPRREPLIQSWQEQKRTFHALFGKG